MSESKLASPHPRATGKLRMSLSPPQVATIFAGRALLIAITSSLVATAVEVQKTLPAAEVSLPSSSWTLNEDSWNQWWSYSGVSGPAYWGLLNTDWFMCDRGRRQSPIDLETKALVYDPHLGLLRADNNLISGVLYNDGHSIVFNCSQTALARSIWLQEPRTKGGEEQADSNPNTTTSMIADSKHHHLISKRRPEPPVSEIFSLDEHSARVHLIDSGAGFQLETSDDGTSEMRLGEVSLTRQEPPMLMQEAANRVDLDESRPPQSMEALDGPAADRAETSDSNQVHLSGAGLAYSYRFEMLQFKFGPTAMAAGSEHRIDGRAFAAELQVFAYNWQLYKSYDDATGRPQGLLAISLLVDAIPPIAVPKEPANTEDNPAGADRNQKLAPNDGDGGSDGGGRPLTRQRQINAQLERLLLSAANSLQHRGAFENHREFNLSALLADGGDQFVTYEGSLSQPGCHETVTWLILNRPLYVSAPITIQLTTTQPEMCPKLEGLRSLSADEQSAPNPTGSLIAGNMRPTQPVNNRPIRTNIRPAILTSAASSTVSFNTQLAKQDANSNAIS